MSSSQSRKAKLLQYDKFLNSIIKAYKDENPNLEYSIYISIFEDEQNINHSILLFDFSFIEVKGLLLDKIRNECVTNIFASNECMDEACYQLVYDLRYVDPEANITYNDCIDIFAANRSTPSHLIQKIWNDYSKNEYYAEILAKNIINHPNLPATLADELKAILALAA